MVGPRLYTKLDQKFSSDVKPPAFIEHDRVTNEELWD